MTFVEADVEGVHGAGRRISGRSGPGGAAAKSLKTRLDGAAAGLGHPVVGTGVSGFVGGRLTDRANRLGDQIDSGGIGVSNVGATARDEDIEGARRLEPTIAETTEIEARINRHAG